MTMTAVRQKSGAAAEGDTAAAQPKSKKKLIMVVALVLALGAGGWFFFLKPGGSQEPQPGAVMPLDSIQVNLEGGHYLRIGIALQLTTKAKEVEGSQALDAVISTFSGLSMTEVNQPKSRNALKDELLQRLEKRYDEEVMEVYFTEFVTQ